MSKVILEKIVLETVTHYQDYYSKRYFNRRGYKPKQMQRHVLASLSSETKRNYIRIIGEENEKMRLPITKALISKQVKDFPEEFLLESTVIEIPTEVYLRLINTFIGVKNSSVFLTLTKNNFLDFKIILEDMVNRLKKSEYLRENILKKDRYNIEIAMVDECSHILNYYNYTKKQPVSNEYHISSSYHLRNSDNIEKFYQAYEDGLINLITNEIEDVELHNGTTLKRVKVTFEKNKDGFPLLELYPTAILFHESHDVLPYVQKIDSMEDVKKVFTKITYFAKSNNFPSIEDVKNLWGYLSNIYDESIVTPKWS